MILSYFRSSSKFFFWPKFVFLGSKSSSIWVQDYPIELKFWENRFLRIRKPFIISDFLFETFSIFWSSPCTPLGINDKFNMSFAYKFKNSFMDSNFLVLKQALDSESETLVRLHGT